MRSHYIYARQNAKPENVASRCSLLFLALLILSAIAATLVTMSSTETTVNANYRSEEIALFAARAGLYEVTDRMMQNNVTQHCKQHHDRDGWPTFWGGDPLGNERGNPLPDQSDHRDRYGGPMEHFQSSTRMTSSATKVTASPE